MTIQEIKELAQQKGLKLGSMKKKQDLVRAIQKSEGNTDCFKAESALSCEQATCLWREDCTK